MPSLQAKETATALVKVSIDDGDGWAAALGQVYAGFLNLFVLRLGSTNKKEREKSVSPSLRD